MRRYGGRNALWLTLGTVVTLFFFAVQFPSVSQAFLIMGEIVLLAAVVFWIIDARRASRNRRNMIHFAETYGWQFRNESTQYSSRFVSFPFGTGFDARQQDLLSGTLNGVECVTFTHTFEVETERGQRVPQSFQVSLVELPVILPPLEVVPETVASKFGKVFGVRDLDVESYTFNKHWRVLCHDRKYAHAVLDPRMIERLLEPDALGLAIRIEGGAVLAWQADQEGVDTLASRLGVLTGVARRIPEHVVREYRERGATNYAGKDRPTPDGAPSWATTPGALTSGKATGIEPGPAATGEAFEGLPWGDERATFNIFDWGAGPFA